jgi:hypothetical protein
MNFMNFVGTHCIYCSLVVGIYTNATVFKGPWRVIDGNYGFLLALAVAPRFGLKYLLERSLPQDSE